MLGHGHNCGGRQKACPGPSGGGGVLLERLTIKGDCKVGVGWQEGRAVCAKVWRHDSEMAGGRQYAEGAGEAGKLTGPGLLC